VAHRPSLVTPRSGDGLAVLPRATSVLAGGPREAGVRVPGPLARLPLFTGLRPPSPRPGPRPAKRPPPRHQVRPEPIPTQARASATGATSTGQQLCSVAGLNIAGSKCGRLVIVAACVLDSTAAFGGLCPGTRRRSANSRCHGTPDGRWLSSSRPPPGRARGRQRRGHRPHPTGLTGPAHTTDALWYTGGWRADHYTPAGRTTARWRAACSDPASRARTARLAVGLTVHHLAAPKPAARRGRRRQHVLHVAVGAAGKSDKLYIPHSVGLLGSFPPYRGLSFPSNMLCFECGAFLQHYATECPAHFPSSMKKI
jgi:hypothetical protein